MAVAQNFRSAWGKIRAATVIRSGKRRKKSDAPAGLPLAQSLHMPARGMAFVAVSTLGLVLQLATIVVLTHAFGVHYSIATVAGVQVAIVNNFFWHERWTWRDRVDRSRSLVVRLLRITAATGTSSFAGNLIFTTLYVQAFGLPIAFSNLLAVGSTSVLNYLALDRVVFKEVSSADGTP